MMTSSPSTDVLAEVPPQVFQSPAYITPRQRWRQSFNVAAWLRFQEPTYETCRLMIRVEDTQGTQDISVDQATIISTVMLLSSRVTLSLTGPIQRMTVILESATPVLRTDELYLQPVKGSVDNGNLNRLSPAPARPTHS